MNPAGPRFALFVEGQEGVDWDGWVAIAEAARGAGFEALLQADHQLSTSDEAAAGSLDAWTAVTALAARVPEIRLGTLVSPVGFRHPASLARIAAGADLVAGGRVEVGLGAGWYEREHLAYGLAFGGPAERFDRLGEQLAILRGLWSGAPSSFSGESYELRDAPPLPLHPAQPGGPPLIVGANGGPRGIALAAEWADEYNTRTADPELCRRLRAALDDACAERGRDPASLALSVLVRCVVGATRAEVEESARRAMRVRDAEGEPVAGWIEGQRQRALVGTFAEAREQVRALHRAGVDRIVIQHLPPTDVAPLAAIGRELVGEPARA